VIILRSALFWDFTQHRMIVCYRRFSQCLTLECGTDRPSRTRLTDKSFNYCPNTLQVFIGSHCLIVPNNTLGCNAELASSNIPTRNWLRCTIFNYCFRHMQYIFISSHCLLAPAKPKIWLFNKNQQNAQWKMQKCAHPAIDQTDFMDAWKKCHKTACTSLPEDEDLDIRNMSKTL
jgi:hypothetical protein